MKRFVTIIRVVWIAAGLAVLLGTLSGARSGLSMLPLAESTTVSWVEGDFKSPGVYPVTAAATLPGPLATVGSWIGGDEWQGRASSAWLKTASRVGVAVAGYPQHPGCGLWAEFRTSGGVVTRLRCDLPDPHERWETWWVDAPAGTTELRLVAEDAAVDPGGWLAFSQPFASPTAEWLSASVMGVKVLATLALALILILGPGVVWTPRSTAPEIALVFRLGLGPAVLVGIGLLAWSLGGWFSSGAAATTLILAVWLALSGTIWRRNFSPTITRMESQVLAVCTLVSLVATAKASFSQGPEGELYGGMISRTLAVGDRSDSRIPFHVVQVVAQHWAPAAPEAERYFSPYTFFSRGPLAGLAAVPVVLATGGRPTVEMPDRVWEPFDVTGFAAYRITLNVLASLVIFALFAVLAAVVGEEWALIGAGLLALSPFGVHEVMFTWPKWEATAALLVSFLFCHRPRPFAGGCVLGVGFLLHPMVGLWLPWLALWAAGRAGDGVAARAKAGVTLGLGASLLILPWMALGTFMPHLATSVHAGQSDFLRYWFLANYQPATLAAWWSTRSMNFADTFFPFWLWFKHADHFVLNSVYAPSGGVVKFSFLWWNTLPLGLGLALAGLAGVATIRGRRSHAAAVGLLVIGPALVAIVYWGGFPVGVMRECGHPLFVAVIGVSCVVAARREDWLHRILKHRAFPWLQLPETVLMLWLTTLVNPKPFVSNLARFDPLYFGASIAALVLAAWILSSARTRSESGV